MANINFAGVVYFIFLAFLGYSLILLLYYFFLAAVGFYEGGRRAKESEEEDYPMFYFSTFSLPVSIIVPARNEEEWIRDCVLSILNLNYPEFELIIVNDGSTDRTMDVLNGILDLKPMDIPYVKHYQDGKVKEILKSGKYSNVTVVNKFAGTKKAGAANAGLNLAKYRYVCVIDADTVMEQSALLKVMAHVQKDPDRIIGIGSYFGLSNGLKIKDGKIMDRSFPFRPIIAYQNLEYIRSFIGNRIAWSRFNAMPIIAGGFGVWRRDIVYELGGYSVDFTCEDIELTFRAHDYIVKNKDKNYRILMLPYYVSWTEGPSNIKSLISQRSRWQRVTNETVWHYIYMFLNPKYGFLGFITFPYYLLYEVIGVFFELISIGLVAAGWAFGVLDIKAFVAFLAFMVFSQISISLLTLLAFLRSQRLLRLGYVSYLVFLSCFEFLFYRWIISIAKVAGTYSYFRKRKTFDQYVREKRLKGAV